MPTAAVSRPVPARARLAAVALATAIAVTSAPAATPRVHAIVHARIVPAPGQLIDNGTIVIRPSRPRYSLDELVRRITPKNRHDESDWGGPLGDEVW